MSMHSSLSLCCLSVRSQLIRGHTSLIGKDKNKHFSFFVFLLCFIFFFFPLGIPTLFSCNSAFYSHTSVFFLQLRLKGTSGDTPWVQSYNTKINAPYCSFPLICYGSVSCCKVFFIDKTFSSLHLSTAQTRDSEWKICPGLRGILWLKYIFHGKKTGTGDRSETIFSLQVCLEGFFFLNIKSNNQKRGTLHLSLSFFFHFLI